MFNTAWNKYNENPKSPNVNTTKPIIDRMFKLLYYYKGDNYNPKRCLETNFGTGNILLSMVDNFKDNLITGIEIDYDLYHQVLHHTINNSYYDNLELKNDDFLDYNSTYKYDLIMSNPPFNLVRHGKLHRATWVDFLYKSFKLLDNNGIMVIILPSYWKQNSNKHIQKYSKYMPSVNILPIFKGEFLLNSIPCDIVYIDKANQDYFLYNLYNI